MKHRWLCWMGIHRLVTIEAYFLTQKVKCLECGREWAEERTV